MDYNCEGFSEVKMRIYDVTIPLSENTPVWKGDAGIRISRVAEIGKRSYFNISRMEMGVHSGTHVDAPRHLFHGGLAIDQIPIESLIGDVQLLEIPGRIRNITPKILKESGYDPNIKKILFRTANSEYWQKDPLNFNTDYTAINVETAELLADQKMQLVGIDYFSISPISDLVTPHRILLEKGVIILENINLREINSGIYEIFCLPLKLVEADGAPARVILREK